MEALKKLRKLDLKKLRERSTKTAEECANYLNCTRQHLYKIESEKYLKKHLDYIDKILKYVDFLDS